MYYVCMRFCRLEIWRYFIARLTKSIGAYDVFSVSKVDIILIYTYHLYYRHVNWHIESCSQLLYSQFRWFNMCSIQLQAQKPDTIQPVNCSKRYRNVFFSLIIDFDLIVWPYQDHFIFYMRMSTVRTHYTNGFAMANHWVKTRNRNSSQNTRNCESQRPDFRFVLWKRKRKQQRNGKFMT